MDSLKQMLIKNESIDLIIKQLNQKKYSPKEFIDLFDGSYPNHQILLNTSKEKITIYQAYRILYNHVTKKWKKY